jgi:hypothetical protein
MYPTAIFLGFTLPAQICYTNTPGGTPRIMRLPRHMVIIHFEQQRHRLRRQLDRTGRNQEWLHNVFFQNIGNEALGILVSTKKKKENRDTVAPSNPPF